MDKKTLSHYGWVVVLILILACMMAFAQPFGLFVADGFKTIYVGFNETNNVAINAALSSIGLGTPAICSIEGHYENDGREPHGIPVSNWSASHPHTYTCQCDCWIVPVGAVYTSSGIDIYYANEELPCGYTPKDGDTYTYGDYIYRYGTFDGVVGWGVSLNEAVVDKSQTSYGAILDYIVNQPVVDMHDTFYDCTSLETAPVIPNTVVHMTQTFMYCSALTAAPAIPNSVKNMNNTFFSCSALTVAPIIPNGAEKMSQTFYNCKALEIAPVIPSSVSEIRKVFEGCQALKTYAGSTDLDGDFSKYVIPNGVADISGMFSNCTLLTKAPVIPAGVKDMTQTFWACTSLEIAPVIPNSVEIMSQTFRECSALTTAPILPANVIAIDQLFDTCKALKTYAGSTDPDGDFSKYVIPNGVKNMTRTFANCKALTISPVIPESVENIALIFYWCPQLTVAPAIPESITNMTNAFFYCTGLTGEISIPCSLASNGYTFTNCPATITYYHIDGCDGSCGA